MIRDALIFMCGGGVGVIVGFFLAGAVYNSRRADDHDRSPRSMSSDDVDAIVRGASGDLDAISRRMRESGLMALLADPHRKEGRKP